MATSSITASSRPPFATTSLYVGDLAPDVGESNLYEFFNSVGPVASIRVCRDANSRRSLGYAYVNYHNIGDAEKALETLNYTPIKGVPCRIMWSQRDPAVRKAGSGNVFVKNLDKSIDNRCLHDTFSLFGNILSCKVATDDQGRSRGHGFVHFETEEAAQEAIVKANGMRIGNKEVYVGPFMRRVERPAGPPEHFTNVYCRGFPPSWTEATVSEVFSKKGAITSIWFAQDSQNRSHACVNFADPAAAKNAVADFNGRVVTDSGLASEEEVAAIDAAIAGHQQKAQLQGNNDQDKSIEAGTEKGQKATEKAPTEKAESTEGSAPTAAQTETSTPESTAVAHADDATEGAENKRVDNTEPATAAQVPTAAPPVKYVLYVARAQDRAERQQQMRREQPATGRGGPGGANTRTPRFEGVNLYIKNLPDSVDDSQLRAMFERFGTITSAKVMADEDGHSKGFGFVCFTTAEEATKAIAEMHLRQSEGKFLYVGLAEQKDRRQARLQHHFDRPTAHPQQGHPPHMMTAMPQAQAPLSYFNASPSALFNSQQGSAPQLMWSHAYPPAGQLWKSNPMMGQNPAGAGGMPPHMLQQPGAVLFPGAPSYRQMPNGAGITRPTQAAMQQGYAGASQIPQATQSQTVPPNQNSKQLLGERLFPLVMKHQPQLAGKITGMMLDMEDTELLMLIQSESELKAKIDEALRVLQAAGSNY